MTMEYLCANFKEVLKTLGLKEEYIESPTFSIVAEELRKKLFSEKKDLNGYFATKKYSEEINPSDIKVEYKEENGQVKIELIGQSSYYSSRQEFNATLSYDIYSKTITYSEFMLGYENYMKNDLVESNLIFQYDNNGNVIYTNLSGKTSNYLKEDGGLYHHTTANEEITTILSNGLEFKKEINYCSNPEYNNGSLNRVFPTASSIMEHFEKPIGRSDSRTIMTRETFDVMSVKYITSDVNVDSYQEIYSQPERMDSYGSLQRLKFSQDENVKRGISGISLLTDEQIEKKINNPSDSKEVQDALRKMSVGRNQKIQELLEKEEIYEKEDQSGFSR